MDAPTPNEIDEIADRIFETASDQDLEGRKIVTQIAEAIDRRWPGKTLQQTRIVLAAKRVAREIERRRATQ